MSIDHHLSDSASPAELPTHASDVEAGRKPFSVLTVNSGSSSLRFTLFKTGESLAPILTGKFERIGLPDAGLSFTDVRANQNNERRIDAPNHFAYASPLVELLEQRAGDSSISAVGHRKKWIGSFAAALGGLDTPVFGARRIKLSRQDLR